MNESESFSGRLQKWRARRKLTQPAAAKLLGIGRTYYSELENGREPGKFLKAKFEILEVEPVLSVDNVNEGATTPRSILKRVREKVGLSQAELARKIHYDLGVVQAVEDGTARASERMIEKMCEVLAIDKEDLMHGSESPRIMDESGRHGTFGATPEVDVAPGSYARFVPLLSWAQAGGLDAGHVDDAYDYGAVISIDIKDRRAFGLRIRGDSMTPEIREGDDAIVCPTWQPRNGDTVIARTIHGDVMCKIYQQKNGGTKIVLSSYNPAHPPIELSREEIAWIYPVGQVVRNYRKQ